MALSWNFCGALWGLTFSLLASVLFGHCLSSEEAPLTSKLVAGIVAIVFSILSLIAFHISTLRCSKSHTLRSLLKSYTRNEIERITTGRFIAKLTRMWKHPRRTQDDMIRELTRLQARTEYGRRHRLQEIRSADDLRRRYPLTSYEAFADYIQRMADGERGVFFNEMPARFGITSGTTGKGKLIPFTGSYQAGDGIGRRLNRLAVYRCTSRPSSLQKTCFLYTHPKVSYAKSGVVIAPYAFFHENDERFAGLSSPPPTFKICDEPCATYIHMLFAIADPNLSLIAAMFSPQLYRALKCIEANWQAMLEDLSTGQINAKLPLSPELRRSLQAHIIRDEGRVTQLRREFQKGFDGIVRRIWPHLLALQGIDILGFRKKLQESYNKETGMPCFAWGYGCTESGIAAVNLWIHDEAPRYVLMPHMAVFEFIPEKHSLEKDPKTLLIDEVEVGERYEIVFTTRSGLYRYRNGDVVQVVGFQENCPIVSVLFRTGEYLNLVYEKTNTQVLSAVVDATVAAWPGLELVEWTCAESPIYDPGNSELYYMLFVEVHAGKGKPEVTEEQKSKFDELLQQSQLYYQTLRASSTISAARVYLVKPDTFSDMRDLVVSRTSSSLNQYKTPRKLRTQDRVQWMLERVYE